MSDFAAETPSPIWTLLTDSVGNNLGMDKLARSILAENLSAVIAKSGYTRSGWALAKRLDEKGVKAVERVVKVMHPPGLEFIEKLAVLCEVEPWQLLHPTMGADLPEEIQKVVDFIQGVPDQEERSALAAAAYGAATTVRIARLERQLGISPKPTPPEPPKTASAPDPTPPSERSAAKPSAPARKASKQRKGS